MKTIVSKLAGYCFGVRRAVAICESAVVEHNNCVTLGPIIQNEYVLRRLEKKGVRHVSDISEVAPYNCVVIRSHGIGKKDKTALSARGVNIIDATCPYVRKLCDIVRDEHRAGRLPVIIGKRSHPETVAISSWCDKYEVFETAGELSRWLRRAENARKPISIVFQTINTEYIYETCAEIVKKVCTNQKIFDTICRATFERQLGAAELLRTSDIMNVFCGRHNANSLRLADVCSGHDFKAVFAESPNDIWNAEDRASGTIEVIAGASTPACIIKEVTQKMSEEVRLEEACVEQGAMEQSSPGVPESSAQDVAPAIGNSEPSFRNSEVTGQPDGPFAPGGAKSGNPESGIHASEPQHSAFEAADGTEPAPIPEVTGSPGSAGGIEGSEINNLGSITEAEQPAVQVPEPEGFVAGAPEAPPEQGGAFDALDESEAASATESFEEMLEKSIKTLHTGQKVTGIVTSITATEVSVDLGTKQSGYIPVSEFTDDANANIEDIISIGDSIESFVMRVNDVEGMVMLSKKRLDAIKNWDVIEAAKENRAIVEGFVTEENKGGVVVNVKGVRVFVPASQTGLPKSSPMTELVRKPVKLRITEVNQSRRRVVGSIRAVQVDERREKSERVWNDIEVGKQYNGVVKSMTSYGVFVDIGGVDGMIHISELSWTRIKQPSEVMAVGDDVSVYVLSFDKENRKISLGYKKGEDNPWTRFTSQRSVGDVVNVKIVKMMPFGAFAEICPGVDGLIHISQITDHRIGLPSEVLSDKQLVDVKITEIDYDRKKVSLSIKALLDPSSQPVTESEAAEAARADKTPVIVYNTDTPPATEDDPAGEAPLAAKPIEENGPADEGTADIPEAQAHTE